MSEMYFEIVGPITDIETIAVDASIRQLARPPAASFRPVQIAVRLHRAVERGPTELGDGAVKDRASLDTVVVAGEHRHWLCSLPAPHVS